MALRRFLLTTSVLLYVTISTYSQKIRIIDSEDLHPISDVAVYNQSKARLTYTNHSGEADISAFRDEKMICFHHFTYEKLCIRYSDIQNEKFEIRLAKKIFAIEEFVISANRWEQKKKEVPNKITTVLKPAIELQNPITAADLIGISDEVFVQKSQLGGGSPMIRGFSTNRILIVVDGVRMNNAIYREGNIQNIISLDPSAVESAEIIFGPGAIVYGSDAIGGVMDFHSKKALFSTGEKTYIKADALTRFSSANREKTLHLDFNAGTRKIAFLSSISWSDFGDLKMGSGQKTGYIRPEYAAMINNNDTIISNPDTRFQLHTAYNQLNTMNKLRFKLSENLDIVVTNHYSALSDVPRYDRLVQYKSGKLRYGDWYYGPQVWTMNNFQLTYSKQTIIFDELKVIAAQQNYKESRHDRAFGNSTINEQFEKVGILSLSLDFDKKFNYDRKSVYYGFEFVNNDIRSVAQKRNILNGQIIPAGSRYPNGDNKYTSFSLYTGYKYNYSDKLTLNSGLRYNHVSLASTIADNSYYNLPFNEIYISNGALTGSVGVVFRIDEKTQINSNTSTGFRAPNLDDAGKVFDSAPGVVIVPNPGLKPEYVYNIDIGASRDFGKIFHLGITAFYSWLTNAMIRHEFQFNGQDSMLYLGEMSKVEAVTNRGSARVYGMHINLQANITSHLSVKSSLNLTEGREESGEPLRHAAPVFGSTHLVFTIPKLTADLYSNYNGSRKYKDMAPSEIDKAYLYASDDNGNPWAPGWVTMNFKLSYEILKRVSANAGIENILDLQYRPYSSGIVSPGRNIIMSVRVKI